MDKISTENGIEHLLTSYKQNNLKDIIYDKIYSSDYEQKFNYQKYNIYNSQIDSPLQKIWIKIPKVKIARSISMPKHGIKNCVPMYVILYESIKEVKKLCLFIKKLERKIGIYIKNDSKNKKLMMKSSIYSSDNFPPTFTINLPCEKVDSCYEFKLHAYNQNNKRINLDNIKSGNYISAFIELESVWRNSKNIGFNWNVLQIKIFPEFDFNKCLFVDDNLNNYDNDNNHNNHNNHDECYHCLYCPNNHIRTHYCFNSNQNISSTPTNISTYKTAYANTSSDTNLIIPPQPPSFPPPLPNILNPLNKDRSNKPAFVPSIKDILSVKLKKVNIDDKKNCHDDETDKLLQIKNNLKVNDKISDKTNETSNSIETSMNKKDVQYLSNLLDEMIDEWEFEKYLDDNVQKTDQEHKKLLEENFE